MLLNDIQGWLSTYFRRKGCAQHMWHRSTEQGKILRREVLYMWWTWKLCEKFISLELSPLGSLSHWLVSRASVGTDPPEVRWAIVSDLTGPGNLEQCPLFCFWFLIIGLQGYLRFLSTGELLPSHIHDFFFSLSPLPSFPPTLSLLPSSACWLFFFFSWKVLFFMIYLLSFQSLFSVSSGYFIYHSGPLGGQSVLRHSYFWGIQCSICLANIGFPLPH